MRDITNPKQTYTVNDLDTHPYMITHVAQIVQKAFHNHLIFSQLKLKRLCYVKIAKTISGLFNVTANNMTTQRQTPA